MDEGRFYSHGPHDKDYDIPDHEGSEYSHVHKQTATAQTSPWKAPVVMVTRPGEEMGSGESSETPIQPPRKWRATAYMQDGKIRRMVGVMPYGEGFIDELGLMLEDSTVVSIKIERVT